MRPNHRTSSCVGRHLILRAFLLLSISAFASLAQARPLSTSDFEKLLRRVAEGWNNGNAQDAADCFTADAVYSQPPEKELYKGREALFKFFGGTDGRKSAMKMTWHHIMFNERTQVGAGEFTFEYGGRVHGVTVIKIREGLISNWREYWYESPLDWERFMGANKF